jgi:integrase
MTGSLRKRGKTWSLSLHEGKGNDGKTKYRTVTLEAKTKKEAQEERDLILQKRRSGIAVVSSKLTVKTYLERWLADYAKPNTTAKTYQEYSQKLAKYVVPALGHVKLDKLQPLAIQGLYTRLQESGRMDGKAGLSAQTVLHIHRILHKAFGQAVKWQLLMRNPCDAVEAPRPQPAERPALTEEQTLALLDAAEGTPLFIPILLGVTTGMRRSEVLGLTWQDVDLEQWCLTVNRTVEQIVGRVGFKPPKTKKSRRRIVLLGFVVARLRQHKAEQAERRLALGPAYTEYNEGVLVVARPDGRIWLPDVFSTDFGAFIGKLDLPDVTFHDLRHSHATQMLADRAPVHVVAARLGHSTPNLTLKTYAHVLPGMQEGVAERLEAAFDRAREARG